MKAKLHVLAVLLTGALSASATAQSFAVTDGGRGVSTVTVVPLQTDGYTGPSRLSNPRLRDYFGPAGVNVDPALAAELDRRINETGKMTTTHGKTYFASGEFSGKTIGQAVNMITEQFQNPPSGTLRSGLDRDGSNAAFFEERRQQQGLTPAQIAASQGGSAMSQWARAGQQTQQQVSAAPPGAAPTQAALDESKRIACLLYPSLKDPNSPLAKKRQEVFNEMQASGSPVSSPDLPLIVTVRAANLLHLKPASE